MQNFILQSIKHIYILSVSKQLITGLQIYTFIYFSLLEVGMCDKGQVSHSLIVDNFLWGQFSPSNFMGKPRIEIKWQSLYDGDEHAFACWVYLLAPKIDICLV